MPRIYSPEGSRTPDTFDVDQRLSDAVGQLRQDTRSPMQDLFALDGLGNEPNEQRPLRSKAAS